MEVNTKSQFQSISKFKLILDPFLDLSNEILPHALWTTGKNENLPQDLTGTTGKNEILPQDLTGTTGKNQILLQDLAGTTGGNEILPQDLAGTTGKIHCTVIPIQKGLRSICVISSPKPI